ncbi:DUF3017 domain-containing protein [Streptomyces sp. NRRL S-475]|uniref:DUF3017 domain-containing protein n=1 Tax=Streptomyces sp. NRRL S-475 TaxID=1463910 RepID=UPI000A98A395|nr:DUF3017 domain-containing protein [Streptomyces sp. NRRL S-475]
MSAEHRAPSGAERRARGEADHRPPGEADHRPPGEADHRPPGEADHRPPGGRETADGQETPSGDESPEELTVRDPISAPDAEGRPRRVTRRFPLFTKDTARPEGGGRAAPEDAPAPARQWPVLAVLGLAGLGLLVTAFGQFRIGTLLIGVAMLGGGALRWLLPDVGMLAVRSRFTDIVTYGLLGTVIVLLALMAQPSPWLQIPFLKDTLHFTVTSE